jgi:hypothetical protein
VIGTVRVIQVSVVEYELLQICYILPSRVGNSTQQLREFAGSFHSDGLCQILPAAHPNGFHPNVGRPTLIIAFRRAVKDLCAAGPTIYSCEEKYSMILAYLSYLYEVFIFSERSNASIKGKHRFCVLDKRNIDTAEMKYYFKENKQ